MPAPASQLALLLDHLAEDRGTVRRPCRVGVLCRPAASESEVPVRATLRNVAAEGIRLDCAHRYPAGETLRVVLPAIADLSPERTLEVRVVYSVLAESGREWIHGCCLLREPLSDTDLRGLAWRVQPHR